MKGLLVLAVAGVLTLSGCYHRLCPTYTRSNKEIKKLEKAQSNNINQNIDSASIVRI